MVSFTGQAGQEICPGGSGEVSSFSCSTSIRAKAHCSTWACTPLQTTPPQFLTGTKGRQGCQSRCESEEVCCVLGFRQEELIVNLSVLHIFCISLTACAFFPWPGPEFFSGHSNTVPLPGRGIHVPCTENKLARQDFSFQRPCWFFLYGLCLSLCSLISYFNTGSSVLTTDERQTQSSSLEPCVWMGLTMAIFQAPDSVTPCIDRLHILASSSAISHLSFFTARRWMAANPGDLLSSNLFCVVKCFLYTWIKLI